MQSSIGLIWLITLISLNCVAAELLPNSINEVTTIGPATKKIGAVLYVKSSSVFEYKYNNIKLKSKNAHNILS